MALELLFLGTGTSAGVPMIGCECDVCRSADPRDKRDRPSVLISYPDTALGDHKGRRQVLVDASSDLRMAALRYQIQRLDAVMITHAHADHVFGLDDLRRFNTVMGCPLDLYTEQRAHEDLSRMFRYIFEPHTNINDSYVPQLIRHTVEPQLGFDLHGAVWTPLRLLHGRQPILGFRVDWQGQSLAYCTDVSRFPPETYPLLEGLDVLVIDALRYRHHPTHLTVDQALEQIKQIRPRQSYFTHLSHEVSHVELSANLPSGVNLPYDGMKVSIHNGAIKVLQ